MLLVLVHWPLRILRLLKVWLELRILGLLVILGMQMILRLVILWIRIALLVLKLLRGREIRLRLVLRCRRVICWWIVIRLTVWSVVVR